MTGWTDSVVREQEYLKGHPEVRITERSPMWRAVITLPDEEIEVKALYLSWLLDRLIAITGPLDSGPFRRTGKAGVSPAASAGWVCVSSEGPSTKAHTRPIRPGDRQGREVVNGTLGESHWDMRPWRWRAPPPGSLPVYLVRFARPLCPLRL